LLKLVEAWRFFMAYYAGFHVQFGVSGNSLVVLALVLGAAEEKGRKGLVLLWFCRKGAERESWVVELKEKDKCGTGL